MTQTDLINKLHTLQTINAVQASKIKSLEEEIQKLTDTAKVWHERYHLLKLYGPDRVDDGPGYGHPAPNPKTSSLSGAVKSL